ncbi:hypothetical protein [Synechococcus sp. CC9605]|uniref:hypothetical protein n=1 Tax=Synechococcus sp. (strain CC9605) TaxID=110662 RepID=UPI000674E38F|nr:hypothetical protein [Synechococcus sp. CC9605]
MNLINRYLGLFISNLLIAFLLMGCNEKNFTAEQESQVSSQEEVEAKSTNTKKINLSNFVESNNPGNEESVLATEPYRLQGIEVSLLDVKRASGDTLNVYWRVSNQSSATQELVKCSTGWYCKYQLAAGNWGDGIYIIDSANQRKHLVVRTDKKPVVSTSETPLSIEPGSSINLWAKFPAPPLDVKKVSIYIPGVAPMEDIPISE